VDNCWTQCKLLKVPKSTCHLKRDAVGSNLVKSGWTSMIAYNSCWPAVRITLVC